MVYMAAYEGPDQNEVTEELLEDELSDDDIDDLCEPKSFYMVPMSFVIHTYSRVPPDSMTETSQSLSTQFSPYRHKVTMFKVYFRVAVNNGNFFVHRILALTCLKRWLDA